MALVAAVFWQTRSFGILNFDDDQYLDPLIRQGLTSPGPPERWAAASWRRYALVLLSFAAGLLSESMLVALPVALLFLDWWPLGRMEGYSGEWGCEQAVEKRGQTDVRQRSLGELVVEKISLLARRPRSPLPLFIGRPHSAAGGSLGCVRGRAHGTGLVESAGLALVHLRLPKELGWSAALVAVLGLTWGGWWQTRHWQSSESLWRYTLSVTKDNAYAHANLASVLAQQGKPVEAAERAWRKAVELEPAMAPAWNNLAGLQLERNELDEAIAMVEKGLAAGGGGAAALTLGRAIDVAGRVDEAVGVYAKVAACAERIAGLTEPAGDGRTP